jgi:predicted aldo/keto reductase-like oxidoreductase
MENREQMMHVANNCFDYERMGKRISSRVNALRCKSCLNCKHCEDDVCIKNLFEYTLISLD